MIQVLSNQEEGKHEIRGLSNENEKKRFKRKRLRIERIKKARRDVDENGKFFCKSITFESSDLKARNSL